MEYYYDVKLHIRYVSYILDFNEAEEFAEKELRQMLYGCRLEKDYPDIEYTHLLSTLWSHEFHATYAFQVSVEAGSLRDAGEKIGSVIRAQLYGGTLIEYAYDVEFDLSEEQPGLDDLLDYISPYEPFAISADANMWHIACAKVHYGEEAVDLAIDLSEHYGESRIVTTTELYNQYPKDQEGNLLHVVWGFEHIREVREAWAHEEEVYASCTCLGSLYDAPKKEEQDD